MNSGRGMKVEFSMKKAKLYNINYEVMSSTLLWMHMTMGIDRMETVACYIPLNADTVGTRNTL